MTNLLSNAREILLVPADINVNRASTAMKWTPPSVFLNYLIAEAVMAHYDAAIFEIKKDESISLQ